MSHYIKEIDILGRYSVISSMSQLVTHVTVTIVTERDKESVTVERQSLSMVKSYRDIVTPFSLGGIERASSSTTSI